MRAYIYRNNELEKVEWINNRKVMDKKGMVKLKSIMTYLAKLTEKRESHYFVELKIDKDE
jgi:hypothetical protein